MDSTAYLQDILRTFRSYKALADKAMAQVSSDADLNRLLDPDSNSIAIIVRHLAGNLRSRFQDFLTTDGEKPWRHRDGEFETPGAVARPDLMAGWNDAWRTALASLEALAPADLDKSITIRGEPFLVIEALNRLSTHTAYHVGQIVFLAKHFAGSQWTSLSIPKGMSGQVGQGDYKQRGLAR